MASPEVAHEALALSLDSLASPERLALLGELHAPKSLKEIRLRGTGPAGGLREGVRNFARQTVRHHLDRLVRAGVVAARPAERNGRQTTEYVFDRGRLFLLSELVRDIAILPGAPEPAPKAFGARSNPPLRLFGFLVLVKGPEEGRMFDLAGPCEGEQVWDVGSGPDVAVRVEGDPSVAERTARIERSSSGFSLVPGSQQGATLNFQPVKGRHPLQTGDIIGMGRSRLVFRENPVAHS